QPLDDQRERISPRTGIRAEAGKPLPAGVSQSQRRRSSAAHASALVRAGRDQRQGYGRDHEGYCDRARLWARHGRHGGGSAGADFISLSHAAAHGLWFSGAVPLRINRSARAPKLLDFARMLPDVQDAYCFSGPVLTGAPILTVTPNRL